MTFSASTKINEQGWPVDADATSKNPWICTPIDDPAYPAVVKRHAVEVGTKRLMQTSALSKPRKRRAMR